MDADPGLPADLGRVRVSVSASIFLASSMLAAS